jgi:hypothetical protein
MAMNAEVRILDTPDAGPSKEESEAARKIISSLLLARKNFSLYPEGHVIIMNSIEQLFNQLDIYLRNYGDLRLDIEKDQLLSQGEAIYTAPPEEGVLPFTFFRDGIRWLEFTGGIDSGELMEFLKIINKYSTLSEEPEGDIVTAFWETQLPHIRYEVADFFWGPEQDSDFIPFPDLGEQAAVMQKKNVSVDWTPTTDPPIDQAAIVLSPDEMGTIKHMVDLEEQGDPTGYLDALLDSLLQDREQSNFEIILEVLEEEFKSSLTRKDFDIALKILQSLQYVLDICATEIPWAVPLIEDFVLTVSSAKSLKPLLEAWSEIDLGQIDKIRQILLHLQPEAIPTLGDMLLRNQSPKHRQILVDVIVALASRDIAPLESLIKHPDEKLMERLVHVFVNLDGERTLKVLLKLLHHPSAYVRQEAVKGILKRSHVPIKEVFSLIDDKDEVIRRLILKHLSQSKDRIAEDLLLRYLEQRKYNGNDSGHIIACFTALGQCGSSRSIAFLRQTLLGRGWLPTFRISADREGAAVGLSKIRTKEAQKVLDEALRCLSPGVRRMVKKLRQERA